jgi:molecular chaperone DnaK (HSP70)
MQVLLARNMPLPCKQAQIFYTMHPGETRIVIPVLEGEEPDPEACARIGQVIIDGLPTDRPPHQPVTVTMAYDRDGILEVTARDEQTQAIVSTSIERTGRIRTISGDAAADAVKSAVVH